ncbi:hypothetical protein [uncultured Aquimarina sp.]|uniref:hypothetical protein n=1 Tax=uncultured Aquimarina sp. TaxID=575652 RepID=UPI002612AC98|nr:hypothetical protein [uncultured Aquimarina sp.]
MNSKKRNSYIILVGFLLIFGTIFIWNYSTFSGIKKNTGYAYGEIVANWESGKYDHDYSRYEYYVDGIKYQGKQGDKYSKDKLVVIVYDKDNPKYSMIAKYPLKLINNKKDTLKIEKKFVNYSWWNYLPVENVSDLWKK